MILKFKMSSLVEDTASELLNDREAIAEAERAKDLKVESLNSVLSNRDNINNLIDEIEALSK
jgi:hypothetical protein